jgi:hypothetical protein
LFDGTDLELKGNLTLGGVVTFTGTATYIFSTNTVYTDNIIEIHAPPGGVDSQWTSNDGKDIGFRFHYYTASTDTNAALVLDNTTTELHWYNSGAESPAGDFSSSTFGTFKTGSIKLAGNVASTATTNGTLIITGGAGISGALYLGENSYIGGAEILTTATVGIYTGFTPTTISAGTDTAVSTSTGAITIWNTSTLQSITNRGATTDNSISITNTSSSTSTTTGALVVTGGVGISGSLNVGGTVNATNFVGAFSGTISGTGYRTDSGVYTTTGTSQIILDSFSTATFRSASYTIQMTSPLGYHVCTLNVIHNGITSDCIQFGDIKMGITVGTFTSVISSGTVQIAMSPQSTGTTTVLFVKTLLNNI